MVALEAIIFLSSSESKEIAEVLKHAFCDRRLTLEKKAKQMSGDECASSEVRNNWQKIADELDRVEGLNSA